MSATDPAFAGFERYVLLSGYSGALIGIVHDRGEVFVRKVAREPSSNAGLKRQRERQVLLRSRFTDGVGMPEVLCDGHVDGRYFFDMQFVNGRDGTTHLGQATFDRVASFTQQLRSLVEQLADLGEYGGATPTAAAFRAKIEQICARTLGRHDLSELGRLVDRVPDSAWPAQASGMHGDLTLENVIVDKGGGIWLIDSIDGPFEHYWQDLAKLFQDCEGHWHRYRGRAVSTGVTAWVRDALLETASQLNPHYRLVHYPLLALTFARILPYVVDDAGRDFVTQRVAAFTRAGHIILDRELT